MAFVVVTAELCWWVTFNLRATAAQHRMGLEATGRDVALAQDLLALAPPTAHGRIMRAFAHLRLEHGVVRPEPQLLGAAEGAHAAHRRMFIAEGTFFFFMVALGGVLIVRTIRLEVGVVRQQANFINAITHELKSPLATMRLYIETLQRREVDPETRARYVRTLRAECDRLETLVGHVLTLSRLEARRQGPAEAQALAGPWAARIDLGAETCAVVQARLRERGEQGVQVSVERPDAPLWAQMDVASWHTIVRNLVDNACKYGEGRPVQVRVLGVGPSIEVSVHDSGIGMAQHELARVLGAFYRVGDEMVRRSEGSGLGLYLTQALLAEFGGEVRVASAGLGQGATFTAVVPREQAPQKEPT